MGKINEKTNSEKSDSCDDIDCAETHNTYPHIIQAKKWNRISRTSDSMDEGE